MRRQKGFTLIELLIVVAIIGIIAAIAIPNLLNALNRGRQKRTMADLRSIATAIESYQVDNNRYPMGMSGSITADTVQTYLVPTYIKKMPLNDGWNGPLYWVSDASGLAYSVGSPGKGGTAAPTWSTASTMTTAFTSPIIFSEGRFTVWPEGTQN